MTTTETITVTEEPVGYDTVVVPETVGGRTVFVARHPELRGCMSHGDTPDEAIANLAEARELWLEAAREGGLRVPDPHAEPSTVRMGAPVPERPQAARAATWRVTFPPAVG